MKYCIYCGQELADDAKFCLKCGKRFPELGSQKSDSQRMRIISAVAKYQKTMQGDDFTEVYELSKKYLSVIIASVVGNKNFTEDILQETYIRIVQSISTLQKPESFLAWAGKIAHNQAVNFVENRKEQFNIQAVQNTPTDENGEMDLSSVADDQILVPEKFAESAEIRKEVQKAMDKLSAPQRQVFACRVLAGFSGSETSDILGMNENTVKINKTRATANMQKHLLQYAVSHGLRLVPIAGSAVLFYLAKDNAYAADLSAAAILKAASAANAGPSVTHSVGKIYSTGKQSAVKKTAETGLHAAKAKTAATGMHAAVKIGIAAAAVTGGTAAGIHFAQTPITQNGMAAHMTFNKTVEDSVSENNGKIHGNPSYINGRAGDAIYLDGVDDYITYGNQYKLNGSYTFSVWVNPENAESGNAGILSKYDAKDHGPYAFYLSHDKPAFWILTGDSSYKTCISDTVLDEDKWSLLTYTYDKDSETMTLFINGQQDVVWNGIPKIIQNDDETAIGRQSHSVLSSDSSKYKGGLDDLRIYNKVLTSDEITALYNNPESGN